MRHISWTVWDKSMDDRFESWQCISFHRFLSALFFRISKRFCPIMISVLITPARTASHLVRFYKTYYGFGPLEQNKRSDTPDRPPPMGDPSMWGCASWRLGSWEGCDIQHYRAIPLYQFLEVHLHVLSVVLRAEQHKPGLLRKLLWSPVRLKNQLKHTQIHYTGTSAYCSIETKCRLMSWYAAQLVARRHHLSKSTSTTVPYYRKFNGRDAPDSEPYFMSLPVVSPLMHRYQSTNSIWRTICCCFSLCSILLACIGAWVDNDSASSFYRWLDRYCGIIPGTKYAINLYPRILLSQL